jgi:hypothetical protein
VIVTRINSDGTMANTFRIGKTGPTILHGGAIPDVETGLNGDLYVQTGNNPRLYIRQINGWAVSSDPGFGYVRQTVSAAGLTSLDPPTSYVAVNPVANTTIQMMPGVLSKTVVIKDESGTAATNVITVTGQDGVTIDGQSGWAIDVNYGALTLTYGGSEWHIVAAITSAPFNQIKL